MMLHYWDALLAATMRESRVYKIYTENEEHFNEIPEIQAVNPIK